MVPAKVVTATGSEVDRKNVLEGPGRGGLQPYLGLKALRTPADPILEWGAVRGELPGGR